MDSFVAKFNLFVCEMIDDLPDQSKKKNGSHDSRDSHGSHGGSHGSLTRRFGRPIKKKTR